jgi:transcriptional regulator with XRE-family HTH domain
VIFKSPPEILLELSGLIRKRRVSEELTQQSLAKRANVSVSSIRKYEQTGHISMESFIKIAYVLDLTDALLQAIEVKTNNPKSIDEILKSQRKEKSNNNIKKRVRKK